MSRAGISVAIATAGRPEALARCLDALAAGTAAPGEVVVVDQGDALETESVVAARADRLPGLRRIAQQRLGLSASRNLARAETVFDVLAVTDDDCVPDADWVASIARALADDPTIAGVTGPMLPVAPSTTELVAVSSRTSAVRVDHRLGSIPWTVGTGGNMAVRRAWLDRVGGWDERLGVGSRGRAAEDVALVDRLLRAGAVIRYEPTAVVRHELRSRAARRTTRWGYGHGIGAMCGILFRQRDARGAPLLARWLALRLRLALVGVAHGRPDAVGDELRVLAGTVGGLAYGIRAGGAR